MRTWITLAALWTAAWAGHVDAGPKSTPVPPTLEIEILDPNVDPLGNPTAVLQDAAPGLMKVDVPPTVLVHKYYYTGDRTFQAKFMPGGPCIVVANHPKTGERTYIPAMLLPGAPKVTYSSKSITYDYGNQTIEICFHVHLAKASVHYGNAVVNTTAVARLEAFRDWTKSLVDRTGVPNLSRNLVNSTKDFTEASADRLRATGKLIATPVIQAGRMLPGANLLSSPAEDRATNLRDARIRKTVEDRMKSEQFIPQNR